MRCGATLPTLHAAPVLQADPMLEANPMLQADPLLEAHPVLEANPMLVANTAPPPMHLASTCSVSMPGPREKQEMMDDCVVNWMQKMSSQKSCLGYFSRVASPACSVADLEHACRLTSENFRLQDAQNLCQGLQNAHADFWPTFWNRF